MTSPVTVPPCNWPINTASVPAWADAEPDQQATAAAVATYVLWGLSGRRFGVCDVTARPAPSPDRGNALLPLAQGSMRIGSGAWFNAWCGVGVERNVLTLPGPVVAVVTVLVDGVALDPTEWRLHGNDLWRVGGNWPATNDLSLADTEPGTWSIAYQRGIPVPVAGQLAAGVLAGEVLKSMRNLTGCRLPSRARSVTREGVDVQLLDPAEFLDGGRTGIPEVDLWLATVNPNRRASSRLAVWSPDVGGRL